MVRLKSRTQWCIGGFKFLDPAISPVEYGDSSWSFDFLCQETQRRRIANPRLGLATDSNTIAAEVDRYNAERMLMLRGGESYVIKDGGPPGENFPVPRRALPGVAGVKRVAAGAGVLLDWLGAGAQAVPASMAEERARVCSDCPQNQTGDWTSWFTAPASALIREKLSARDSMGFQTQYDDQLNVCAACSCPLKLKVHVPINHISARMNAETKAKLDPRCWILKETA